MRVFQVVMKHSRNITQLSMIIGVTLMMFTTVVGAPLTTCWCAWKGAGATCKHPCCVAAREKVASDDCCAAESSRETAARYPSLHDARQVPEVPAVPCSCALSQPPDRIPAVPSRTTVPDAGPIYAQAQPLAVMPQEMPLTGSNSPESPPVSDLKRNVLICVWRC